MRPVITLTTDFGLKDPYQGAMKGAILSINPEVRLVDITHQVRPGDIVEGAFILFEAYKYFPAGTIHIGVVDPGVGGSRRPILVRTDKFFFIGPVAAHLSLGVSPSAFGPEIDSALTVAFPEPEIKSGVIIGEAVYVDSFGNIITNINAAHLAGYNGAQISIKGRAIKGLTKTYSAAKDSPIALIGSSGHLEIALNNANASQILGVTKGEKVTVKGPR